MDESRSVRRLIDKGSSLVYFIPNFGTNFSFIYELMHQRVIFSFRLNLGVRMIDLPESENCRLTCRKGIGQNRRQNVTLSSAKSNSVSYTYQSCNFHVPLFCSRLTQSISFYYEVVTCTKMHEKVLVHHSKLTVIDKGPDTIIITTSE
jgi:hypothetical protein